MHLISNKKYLLVNITKVAKLEYNLLNLENSDEPHIVSMFLLF